MPAVRLFNTTCSCSKGYAGAVRAFLIPKIIFSESLNFLWTEKKFDFKVSKVFYFLKTSIECCVLLQKPPNKMDFTDFLFKTCENFVTIAPCCSSFQKF